MNRPPVPAIQLPDPTQMRVQRVAIDALAFLYGQPFGQPMAVQKNVALTTAFKNVRHGLGRPMQGYLVARSSAPAMVSDADATTDTTNQVQIMASAATTVTLIFF